MSTKIINMMGNLNKNKWVLYFNLIFLISFICSCKKFVQVDPPSTSLVGTNVFANDPTASAAVTSIYYEMITNGVGLTSGYNSISFTMGLYADELKNYSSDLTLSQFYANSLNNQSITFWPELYNLLYLCNKAIEGLTISQSLSNGLKQQLLGEAKFMRGFLLFYGTNLYGNIPLVTSTNYNENNKISCTPSTQIYQQVLNDLLAASSLLTYNYLTPSNSTTTERVRPNKGAAQALLARVYLYMNDWPNAITMADSVIANTSNYSLVSDINKVFQKNSSEAIWQLQSITPGYNTFDGFNFILTSPPGSTNNPVAVSDNLLSAFESGDKRSISWIDSLVTTNGTYYYPYKYKIGTYSTSQPITEYLMVLRLAEQYLIRAEAKAQQNNISGAQSDLNIIRYRAGLGNTNANDKASLLASILHERQVELFTEWGHRWLDLKRTGNTNTVMAIITPKKGGSWNSNWQVLPIPQSEILINPNLTQNQGY